MSPLHAVGRINSAYVGPYLLKQQVHFLKIHKGYYDILNVEMSASQEDIKSAYYSLSKLYHPDRNQGDKGSEVKFKAISEAYEALGNVQKRQAYDREILARSRTSAFNQPRGNPTKGAPFSTDKWYRNERSDMNE